MLAEFAPSEFFVRIVVYTLLRPASLLKSGPCEDRAGAMRVAVGDVYSCFGEVPL